MMRTTSCSRWWTAGQHGVTNTTMTRSGGDEPARRQGGQTGYSYDEVNHKTLITDALGT